MNTVSRLITTFVPHHYDLSIVINRSQRVFDGVVTITGDVIGDSVTLHSKGLEITNTLIDGKAADFTLGENDELTLTQAGLETGSHIIVLGFTGRITDPMHGMYPCYFEHGGEKKELIATQFESHHAREVFPCIDEPEAKATFDVTLTTEKDVTVLGNMPVKLQREENDYLVTSFETTPRMSSYLLAWVIGELHKKTQTTNGGVEVNVWATPAQSPESLDFALETAVRAIDFFDEYFDTPYPLPKSDHVALPDFSSGAMENWGLITYREVALLADPKTTGISTKRYVATVVAHELSHQWFGNLVTMKWWNNLWLNESFANLMEYVAVDALYPEWDIWLEYSAHESIMALRRDAIDGVQSVQVDVHHPDEISSLFDGAIVYAKGGRLLRMLERYIGKEAFQKGLASYFKKYAYANTDGSDLWNELGAASGRDIADFMNIWISQPGYPIVSVTSEGLQQKQFFIGPHEQSSRLWPIPLNSNSSELPILFDKPEMALAIPTDTRFNIDDSAHFVTQYQTQFLLHIIESIKKGDLSPVDRLQFLHEQTLLARSGIISSTEIIPLLEAYAKETNDNVWDIIALALGELKKFVEDDENAERALRDLAGQIATTEYERLGWDVRPDESENDTKLRSTIMSLMAYSERPEVIEKAKKLYDTISLEDLDPEMRALILHIVVRHHGDASVIDSLLDAYRETQLADLQNDICSGLTSTRDSETIVRLLSIMTDSDTVRSQDVFRWFVYLVRGRESRELAWRWVQEKWSWIEDTFGGDKSFDDFPRYAASGLSTREQFEQYKAFFMPKQTIPALTRVIDLGIAEIEGRIELIERDGAAVREALAKL